MLTDAAAAGASRSSRNSLKHGLFAAHDFVREGEEAEYLETVASLTAELAPKGPLEQTFTTEIIGATWRLRRCRILEEDFSLLTDVDPMTDEKTEKQQRSVDRARAQSHLVLRRSIAELRVLQTERQVRIQLFPDGVPGDGLGVMDFRKAVQLTTAPQPRTTADLKAMAKADVEAMMAKADKNLAGSFCKAPATAAPSAPTSFCKTVSGVQAVSSKVPRNVPCPCGSGLKYKRCCGNPAGTALKRTA
jgi:hypothetical protein